LQAEEERLLEERRELDRVRQAIINQEAERLLEARKYKQKYHKTSSSKMSYQNFESSGAGPSNPRQAPPSPSQGISHGNGMNGIGMNPGMVGFPTPAGHQADLNYIMGMVEELSRTLAHNQNLTASIVQKAGEVRELARSHDLSNDEILARAAEALNCKFLDAIIDPRC
jgi:DNA-binding protein H-NS